MLRSIKAYNSSHLYNVKHRLFNKNHKLFSVQSNLFDDNIKNKTNSFTRFPPNSGLYDSSLEKDSCGVGLVANMKKLPSRKIVLNANQMLVRMSHRGGCGCEENAGDGAGTIRTLSIYLMCMRINT